MQTDTAKLVVRIRVQVGTRGYVNRNLAESEWLMQSWGSACHRREVSNGHRVPQ